ncbi:novel acyl-CoA-dehydrogenase protein [Elysia marginata]|uniref:Novel acyl-CoA-dehydrogenase protein n=1 Tax=Elysia marginata TaxID=1093978 RepID=A0AAV4JPB3_9GAST|nr:novel acyl-CoA-dehydrogenase protein [Elysia marginata]
MFLTWKRSITTVTCLQAHAKAVLSTVRARDSAAPFGLGYWQNRKYSNSLQQQNEASNTESTPEAHPTNIPSVPFAHARLGPFFQEEPQLKNQFSQDAFLQGYLQQHVPTKHLQKMRERLENLGERVANDIYQLSKRMESEPPRLEQINAWGKRVDNLITSTAWQDMKSIAAQEGLVASGYEREFDEWSRLFQMTQFYLFEPSGGLYGCPLAMTNGAARTVELLRDTHPWLFAHTFPHLTSRDPDQFWTSGQWMTEKKGGSDVAGGTETVAVEQADGSHKLYGYKWFSSATDADMTLTLARLVDGQGNVVKGTRGLSLFYLDVKGQRSNIQIMKLKNKLGTRQLPTAEILMDGAIAYKISEEGRGVSAMSQMLTLTRIHTAIHAASTMRRSGWMPTLPGK